VYRLKSLEELPTAIRQSLRVKVKLSDVNEFMNLLHRSTFEFDFFGHDKKIFDEFHGGGFLISNEISMTKLKIFFEKNNADYELLTLEHIKKINQYKKLEKRNQ
jgi:hypothetical protein